MGKEARAMEGMRTFREYGERSGISYEAVRKKVENHQKNYRANRLKLETAISELNMKLQIVQKYISDAEEKGESQEYIDGLRLKLSDLDKQIIEARERLNLLNGFYDGVLTDENNVKYLNEAAQAYLDQQRKESVVTVPDRDSKAALKVAQDENEMLRRQIVKLQEALLTERTGKLQDLQEADRSAVVDAEKRIQWLESRVKVLAEEVEDLQNEVEALQITKKTDYDRLTERIDDLYTEVLKTRKRGIFGRIKED